MNMSKLIPVKKLSVHELEVEVEERLPGVFRLAEILTELQERKEYKKTHQNFGSYVLERFKISKATAYRLIGPSRPPKTEVKTVDVEAEKEVKNESERSLSTTKKSHGETHVYTEHKSNEPVSEPFPATPSEPSEPVTDFDTAAAIVQGEMTSPKATSSPEADPT